MNAVDQIEKATVEYVMLGLNTPDFAFVSTDVYSKLLKETGKHSMLYGSPYLTLHTSCSLLQIIECSGWPKGSIVIEDHCILSVLEKLEVIG